jgi:protein-S-isoprenylcysteine O-methyltransferase Ste14
MVRPSQWFELIWIVWLASWITASFWSGRAQKRVGTWETWTYRIVIIAGAILLAPWTARILSEAPIWRAGNHAIYALVGLMAAGLLFTWWARLHLGRLWSSAITRKENHRLIDTGPYGLVRHPIYTGIIAALLATAAIEATPAAIAGAVMAAAGLWLKARTEERFLTNELGAETYASYCRRVPMLVPFLRGRNAH